jgi:endonuclease YncB( thermonuclease family)
VAPTEPNTPITTITTTIADPTSTTSTVARPMRDDVAVRDGDTFSLTVGGVVERIRLIGIDAPEVGECQADRSTAALEALLLGATDIVLVADRTDRDRYGRLLRYVEADGVSVNEALVRSGLALSRPYPPDTARQDPLDRAQAAAEREQLGLWNPGACGTPSTASLAITAIEADPPGDDTQALTQEYVEITNTGSQSVDLTGWGVKDNSASHRYLFPAGFVLTPGAAVRLRTGCGVDGTADLYWCESGSAVWNNAGDTVFVLDPNGNIVATRSYP